jgi:tripartite-type tricarboxylate transporter receptor subunit TctC
MVDPVSLIATSPFVITVGSSFPASTLEEFIAYVKARPGQLSYAAAGHGSMSHISAAVFLKRAGLDMTMVPYKGLAPAFTDVLSGNVHMVSATPVELKPFIESKKVKMLGSSGPKRSSVLPDVPAIAETIAGHAVETWNGVLVPANTPQAIVDALAREMIAAQNSREFRERLQTLGVDPVVITPAEFEKLIAADTERWRKLVPEMGLDVQR